MAEFIEAIKTSELNSGQMKKVNVKDKAVLIARAGDTFYAADNACPHLGGDLSKGKLEGMLITCPLHKSQFDLSDGHVLQWTDWTGIKLSVAKTFKSPRPLKVYEVKVEGDNVMVGPERITTRT